MSRAVGTVMALTVLSLVAVGCGAGGSPVDVSADAPPAPAAPNAGVSGPEGIAAPADQVAGEQLQRDIPAPSLPADQAEKWRAAFQKMADCFKEHGIEGVPDAPPTFGDGQTKPPLIRSDGSPQFQDVVAACPFDTSGFDKQVFEAAAAAATPPTTSRDSLPPEIVEVERQLAGDTSP